MASSEGVSFRWEVFNRWCDEYSQLNNGNKPKVEDVRRWHRENAEKVWPDSSERPSVFLAVSHNKGRRVRGHKTCEYYKRYRAGKAAEQQLAARLQPAALSGRRILAVTAAARKINTDCGRTVVKRGSSDDVNGPCGSDPHDEDPSDLGHTGKRRRMRTFSRSFIDQSVNDPHRGAGLPRSSSDGPSEDPSWASGAETSNEEDDGVGYDSGTHRVMPAMGPARRFTAAPPYTHARGRAAGTQVGVHITVVRRDADGRTIQVETQPAWGGPSEQSGRQAALPHLLNVKASAAAQPAASSPGGSGGSDSRQPLREGSVFHPTDSGYRRHFATKRAWGRGCGGAVLCHGGSSEQGESVSCEGSGAASVGEGEEVGQPRRRKCDDDNGGSAGSHEWGWTGHAPKCHPGVAPPACRRVRSRSEPDRAGPPPLSGCVSTPIGPVPVYRVGSVARAPNRIGGPRHARSVMRAGDDAAATRDPLDLLAEAACGALASPRPMGYDGDDLEAHETAQGAAEPLPAAKPVDAQGRMVACGHVGRPSSSADSDSAQARQEQAVGKPASAGGRQDGKRSPDTADQVDACGQEHPCVQRHQQQQPAGPPLLVEGTALEVVKHEPSNPAGQTEKPSGDGGCGAAAGQPTELPEVVAAYESGASGGGPSSGGAAAVKPEVGLDSLGDPQGCGPVAVCGAPQLQQQPEPQDAVTATSRSSPDPVAQPTLPLQQVPHSPPPKGPVVAAGSDRAVAWPADASCADGTAAGALTTPAAVQSACGLGTAPKLHVAELDAAEVAGRAVSANLELAGVAAALLQGQPAGLPLSHPSPVGGLGMGLGLGPVAASLPALPFSGLAVGTLPLPEVLQAAAAMAAATAASAPPPPVLPPMLWPSLASGVSPMLPGAPPLTAAAAAAAPLFADASVFGGALVGAGSTGSQLLPMMRLLQMQMATRSLDPGSCHD